MVTTAIRIGLEWSIRERCSLRKQAPHRKAQVPYLASRRMKQPKLDVAAPYHREAQTALPLFRVDRHDLQPLFQSFRKLTTARFEISAIILGCQTWKITFFEQWITIQSFSQHFISKFAVTVVSLQSACGDTRLLLDFKRNAILRNGLL